jgi:hypothetical protein
MLGLNTKKILTLREEEHNMYYCRNLNTTFRREYLHLFTHIIGEATIVCPHNLNIK